MSYAEEGVKQGHSRVVSVAFGDSRARGATSKQAAPGSLFVVKASIGYIIAHTHPTASFLSTSDCLCCVCVCLSVCTNPPLYRGDIHVLSVHSSGQSTSLPARARKQPA